MWGLDPRPELGIGGNTRKGAALDELGTQFEQGLLVEARQATIL